MIYYCRTHNRGPKSHPRDKVYVFSEANGNEDVLTVEEALRKYGNKIRFLYSQQHVLDWGGQYLSIDPWY